MAKSPPKYSPMEWHARNQMNFTRTDQERAAAERLRAECERLRRETEATTSKTQDSNHHKLSQRLRDVTFWKEELQSKLTENAEEITRLLDCKEELEKALTDTYFPMEVATNCLGYREKRVGEDLVCDEVELGLQKEVKVIEGVQVTLQRMLAQATEQIRLLKSCKYKLEKNLTDKFGALKLDSTCITLTDRSQGIGYSKEEAIKIQTNSVTPEQWSSFSDVDIIQIEKERDASSTLRGLINGVLEETKKDILKQKDAVNLAFSKRIHEVRVAKQQLEQHLDKVVAEIQAMEQNVSRLQEAIEDKTGPMMLAQTRLDIRSHRPNNELVRDPAQYGLVDEVGQIENSIENLKSKLNDSQNALKALNRNKLTLKDSIDVKINSLEIDERHCLALRSQLK